MAKSIWGYGSLKLNNSTYSVLFPYAIHRLYYEVIKNRQTAITGLIHLTTNYFRPRILAQISICDLSDITKLIDLVQMLNTVVSDPVYCTPQYNTLNTLNNTYEVYIESKEILFAQLANALVGQTITILFIGRTINILPTNTSNAQIAYMIDHAGNGFVDQSGNKLTLRIS